MFDMFKAQSDKRCGLTERQLNALVEKPEKRIGELEGALGNLLLLDLPDTRAVRNAFEVMKGQPIPRRGR